MDLLCDHGHSLPAWLPDETVFSWASRYHCLAGHRLSEQTCLALFGDRRRGSQHDLPDRLGSLAQKAASLGAPDTLVLEHTLLRYYLVPRPREEAASAIKSLIEPTPGVLKFRLGILTSRFRADHPLKACPRCITTDEARWGTSYWHLTHQYPGVWMCAEHGLPLRMASIKANGVDRFGWVLPQYGRLIDVVPDAAVAALRKLTELVQGWTALAPGSLTPTDLAATYRLQMRRAADGPLRASRDEAARSFANSIALLRLAPEMQGLPASPAQAKNDLSRWIYAPRGGTHPLRHLALIYWLFPTWLDFLAVYADARAQGHQSEEPQQISATQIDPRREAFARALAAGRSATASSKLVGVTVGTGLAWATQLGVTTSRRPKSMSAALQMSVAGELARGDEKSEIAERHQISIQAVTRVLRSEVGLADLRHAARHDRAQHHARRSWLNAVEEWPASTLSELRRFAGAAYTWLRRHDRAWLTAHAPARARSQTAAPRVDWDLRDAELAAAVQRVAAELAAAGASARVRAWEIYRALPELKAKQGALNRLPLTSRALALATRRGSRTDDRKLF